MLISLVTRSTSALSFILSFSSILIATYSFVIVWVPIRTFPNVPCPSDLPNIYQQTNIKLTNYVMADRSAFVCWNCSTRLSCFGESFMVCNSSYTGTQSLARGLEQAKISYHRIDSGCSLDVQSAGLCCLSLSVLPSSTQLYCLLLSINLVQIPSYRQLVIKLY